MTSFMTPSNFPHFSFDIYFPQTAVAGHLLAIQSLGVVGLQLDAYVERVRALCLKAGLFVTFQESQLVLNK